MTELHIMLTNSVLEISLRLLTDRNDNRLSLFKVRLEEAREGKLIDQVLENKDIYSNISIEIFHSSFSTNVIILFSIDF